MVLLMRAVFTETLEIETGENVILYAPLVRSDPKAYSGIKDPYGGTAEYKTLHSFTHFVFR